MSTYKKPTIENLWVVCCHILNCTYGQIKRELFKFAVDLDKVKVGVLHPVQQPGSYWDRSSELPLVGLEPTEVTAYAVDLENKHEV